MSVTGKREPAAVGGAAVMLGVLDRIAGGGAVAGR